MTILNYNHFEQLETKPNLLHHILRELHEVETNIYKLEIILGASSSPEDKIKPLLLASTRKNK